MMSIPIFMRNYFLCELLRNCYFFLCDYSSFVVEFIFVPERTVVQMCLTCSWTSSQVCCSQLVVSSSLVSALGRSSSFRMCHFTVYLKKFYYLIWFLSGFEHLIDQVLLHDFNHFFIAISFFVNNAVG
jgi:hypothetical protein